MAADTAIPRAAEGNQQERTGSWACCVLLQNHPCSAWLGTEKLGGSVTGEDSADPTPITEDNGCLCACWFCVQWPGLFEGMGMLAVRA